MNKNRKVLLAAPALLLFLISCSTPPPVRDPTSPYWNKVTKPYWLDRYQNDANSLTLQVRDAQSALGPVLNDHLKNDTLASLQNLRQALDSSDIEEASAIRATLKDQSRWLWGYLENSGEVKRLRVVVGNVNDSPINREIDRTLANARRALGGTSWPDVQTTYEKLRQLREQKLRPAEYYLEVEAELRNIGDISASLTAQMQAAMEPLRSALREGSWEEQWRALDSLRPPAGYALGIRGDIQSGEDRIKHLAQEDARELAAAVKEAREAMQGDSWERLRTLADRVDVIRGEFDFLREPTPCVRILSIDGGGIRGIIPATFLQMLEDATGKRVAEMFDVIGGTSTGGILALGLAMPDQDNPGQPLHKAERLIELYEKEGKQIFPASPFKLFRMVFGPRYKAEPFEEVLDDFFEETMLDDAVTNVVVPAYSLDIPGHLYLTTYGPDPSHLFMWEVARATSAAPTYFPPYNLPLPPGAEKGSLQSVGAIDGGVFANNPAPYVVSLAKRWEHGFNNKPYDHQHRLMILSLGTGRVPDPLTFEKAWGRGGLGWISPLINIMTSDPGMENYAHMMMGPLDEYLRLQPEIEKSNSRLDDVSTKNISRLKKIPEEYLGSHSYERGMFNRFIALLRRERPPECQRIVRNFAEQKERDEPEPRRP